MQWMWSGKLCITRSIRIVFFWMGRYRSQPRRRDNSRKELFHSTVSGCSYVFSEIPLPFKLPPHSRFQEQREMRWICSAWAPPTTVSRVQQPTTFPNYFMQILLTRNCGLHWWWSVSVAKFSRAILIRSTCRCTLNPKKIDSLVRSPLASCNNLHQWLILI